MWDKLEDIERKFEALTDKMSSQEVASNAADFRQVAKERAGLEPVVEAFRRYRSILEQIAENRAFLDEEKDPELCSMAKEEIDKLESDRERVDKELRLLLLPKEPNDEKNVILEVRAGTGGEEAALFAGEILRMYLRFVDRRGWRAEILSKNETERGGIKEAVVRIEGDEVFSYLKYESGVHRVQRVPETEAQGRVHTSAASVMVLPEAEEVDLHVDEKDLRIDVFRASGPGGQSVNTTDSAVRITHLPSGITVSMQDEKSQHKNRSRAMLILRTRLLEAEEARLAAERRDMRRAQVRTGDRSEKIRTYNFPQDRLTDHRIGLTRHNLDGVLAGDLDSLISACRASFQAEALKAEGLGA